MGRKSPSPKAEQIIELVRANPRAFTLKELSRQFGISGSRVDQIVNRYELRQLVSRQREKSKLRPLLRKAKPGMKAKPQRPVVGKRPVVKELVEEMQYQQLPVVKVDDRPLRSPCPRCGGRVTIEQDGYGWYEHCLPCGYMRDLEGIQVAVGSLAPSVLPKVYAGAES